VPRGLSIMHQEVTLGPQGEGPLLGVTQEQVEHPQVVTLELEELPQGVTLEQVELPLAHLEEHLVATQVPQVVTLEELLQVILEHLELHLREPLAEVTQVLLVATLAASLNSSSRDLLSTLRWPRGSGPWTRTTLAT